MAAMQWLREFGLFLGDMFRHWVGAMTGALSLILAVVPIVWPKFFGGDLGVIHNRWIWWSAAALSFVVASRLAWDQQRRLCLEAEEKLSKAREEIADLYPRLKGEIKIGYLEIGKRWEKDQIFIYPGSCVATFYLHVVNHSNQIAVPHLPPLLKLTINGRDYVADYVHPDNPNRMRMNDSLLKGGGRITDLFQFSYSGMGMGAFQKPHLRGGWLIFNLPESQDRLDGVPSICGEASITIKDTLGGEHVIRAGKIEFRLNKMGFTPGAPGLASGT